VTFQTQRVNGGTATPYYIASEPETGGGSDRRLINISPSRIPDHPDHLSPSTTTPAAVPSYPHRECVSPHQDFPASITLARENQPRPTLRRFNHAGVLVGAWPRAGKPPGAEKSAARDDDARGFSIPRLVNALGPGSTSARAALAVGTALCLPRVL
jgi:hypothetical protein